MARFGDLTSATEIKEYLLDVVDRSLSSDKDACIYHYTNFTSLYKILTSGYIWLGSTQKMNDYLEGEFIEAVDGSHKLYSVCFSRAEENLAMYKMYAPDPDGAMLVVPLSLAKAMINDLPDSEDSHKIIRVVKNNILTEETTPADLYWTAVAYKDLHKDTLRVSTFKNEAIKNPLTEKILAGFIKLHGWEYEKEIRLVAHVYSALTDDDKVAIKLPKEFAKHFRIVTGPAFDKMLHRAEIAQLKRKGIAIHDSEYDALVDLGGSIKDDEKKRIRELEAENNELRYKIKKITEEGINYSSVSDKKEYIKEYTALLKDAHYVLSSYSNVYTDVVEKSDERHDEAMRKLRDIGIKFEVFAASKSYSVPEVPSSEDLLQVSREFIGLSNSIYVYKGGDIIERIIRNSEIEERIKTLLRIK